jgi:hypothetical protein
MSRKCAHDENKTMEMGVVAILKARMCVGELS